MAYRKKLRPEDATLPLDLRGRPNRSYLGHKSLIVPTPGQYEGGYLEIGQARRRFPLTRFRTPEIELERKRLAAIENPGKCQARQNRWDGWCQRYPTPGLEVCYRHGGWDPKVKKGGQRKAANKELQQRAAKIIKQNLG